MVNAKSCIGLAVVPRMNVAEDAPGPNMSPTARVTFVVASPPCTYRVVAVKFGSLAEIRAISETILPSVVGLTLGNASVSVLPDTRATIAALVSVTASIVNPFPSAPAGVVSSMTMPGGFCALVT